MKRIVGLLTALLIIALCGTGHMEVTGKYIWKGHTIEVTSIDKFTQLPLKALKENEYTVVTTMTVGQDIWKDKNTLNEFYNEAALVDTQGKTYRPQASGTGRDEPGWVFFFCIPDSVSLEELSFSPGEKGSKVNKTGDQLKQSADGPAVLAAEDGSAVTLTPVEAEKFKQQDDNVIVHTRIGETAHNSGSIFLPGSGLRLTNMRNTKQYAMPMVAFTFESALEFDKAADALGAIGKKATLTLEGKTYTPQLAWITEEMACFIFDCPELPTGAMRFSAQDNALFIEP